MVKPMIKIISAVDVVKRQQDALLAEQDYWLLSLNDAIKKDNEEDIWQAKKNLFRIGDELKSLESQISFFA